MPIDPRLGEIDRAAFAAENATVLSDIARRTAPARTKPVSKDEQELYHLLGPNGGLPVHSAKALARIISGLMERIAVLEAAQNSGA
jgi:hypothetical protein